MSDRQKAVLIVEDDPFLSDMYSVKFSGMGYDAQIAEDGARCLDMLKGGLRPDVILMDIVMPKMDGMTLLTTLKNDEQLKSIPVILLTNLGQESDIARGMELGALDYLIKAHFTPSEVVAKVEEIIKKTTSS